MKKNIIFLTIFSMLNIAVISPLFTADNKISAVSGNIEYKVYDAQTHEILRTYTLSAPSNMSNSRFIFGEDTRTIDYTNSGMVKLVSRRNNDYISASAFVVDDHVIATAAHCVNNDMLTDVILFNNNGTVTLHATPVEIHVPLISSSYANDYALITVEEDLSSYEHLKLAVPLDSFTNYRGSIYTTGFPKYVTGQSNAVNTASIHNEYTSSGYIYHISNDLIYYRNDITDGNSGGPVYIKENYNDEEIASVVGITGGDSSEIPITIDGQTVGITVNTICGERITPAIIKFYKNNGELRW